jgi:hypothetical protein
MKRTRRKGKKKYKGLWHAFGFKGKRKWVD